MQLKSMKKRRYISSLSTYYYSTTKQNPHLLQLKKLKMEEKIASKEEEIRKLVMSRD